MADQEVVDQTTQTVDTEETDAESSASDAEEQDTSTTESETDTSTETEPAEKTGKEAQEFMENLLAEYDLDSPGDLKEFIGNLAGLKEKLGDEDVDDLLDNKSLMVKYQRHWAAEEAKKLKENETPEQTIDRLEKELEEKDKEKEKARGREQEARESQRLLTDFNRTVTKTIKGLKEVPSEYRPFFKLFMGVDNPINDVDLGDKGTIIDLTKKGAKTLQDFEQAVIKRYKAGKTAVPAMTKATEPAPTETSEQPKTLKESRKLFRDILLGKKKVPK